MLFHKKLQLNSLLLLFDLPMKRELSSRGRCLSNQPIDMPIETTVVNNSLPGLSWSLDDQCKMRHGPNASFCRVCQFFCTFCFMQNSFSVFCSIFVLKYGVQTQSSLICSLLVCRFTPDTGSCTGSAPAAEGSFCDTGKVSSQQLIHVQVTLNAHFF